MSAPSREAQEWAEQFTDSVHPHMTGQLRQSMAYAYDVGVEAERARWRDLMDSAALEHSFVKYETWQIEAGTFDRMRALLSEDAREEEV